MDAAAFAVSLQLAVATTLILALIGLPLVYWLSHSNWRGKPILEAVVALPLVLPPTVVGFYILIATSPDSPVGQAYAWLTGGMLPFSFEGLLVASVICNLPFAIRPFSAAVAGVDRRLIEASWCLGVSRIATFLRVSIPLAWPGILTGLVLTFAHTIGEFGVVLMVGGNIAGVTRTMSISIYDDVQALDYASANRTALVLVLFALAVLTLLQFLSRRTTHP